MINNIPEEIKKSEERTEKRMVELIKERKRNRGKAARRGKNEIRQ